MRGQDFPLLDADMTVGEALERIRREGVGERVIYFYAVDERKTTRGCGADAPLASRSLERPLREIMVRRVVAIPATATVLDACEFFVLYKFFAFPIIDEDRRVVGVIDVGLFAEEVLQAGDRDTRKPSVPVGDDIFEAWDFTWSKSAAPRRGAVFSYRFRWLLVTVTAGLCARF